MSISVADLEALRPRLFRLAYRMLGSRQDAEDALQEALLRAHRADAGEVRSPEAWVTTVLSRICLDRLRALKVERQAYVGPWLPEPLIGQQLSPDAGVDLASDLSMALLVVLEQLSPEERTAFLMHDVFDCNYAEVSRAVGRSEPACRQLVHRARERLRRDRPRFVVPERAHHELVSRYVEAVQTRDVDRIAALLAPDAILVSDGGGKAYAARRPILGSTNIARLEVGVMRKVRAPVAFRIAPVNGQPGVITYRGGVPFAVTSIETDGERVLSLLRVLNPDKLACLPPA
jgi:RNA polymerase sigma-70 factor (ECF subfamily)